MSGGSEWVILAARVQGLYILATLVAFTARAGLCVDCRVAHASVVRLLGGAR
ncbi:hypothetical protein HCA58_18705 [Micromonospora sp. HNM0581]|uniref:hypothetical protein n=1 Tax=Micromonospora sp. HNM0581 TaxID=2716341 RepID=UPI001469AD3B|nr:hypothetical protein [Micromonospora sp. HNM0581]NLU80368.1 hypothetical protein [Micromonospora sp. HNM0581]